DVANERTLGRENRPIWREWLRNAECIQEPALLRFCAVSGPGERAGVADRPGELRLPAPDNARDNGLIEDQLTFVVAAWFHVKDCGLGALIGVEPKREIPRGIMDVYVLPGRDERGRPPSGRCQILRNRGREPT